ncbi:type II toxin-antitoxin system HicB family antitoxin [Duganella sp. HH101]|uniref:type II toxin-antitoxin system HicB family antitoxin n=1 Tax=Duganella sp. HH101 TaxID=1781066 RepID=UPI00087544EF|nr:type II toxin-antitoxin system HicB family antitoxin [Duganella sp. HH101]
MQYPARFEPDLEAGGYVVTFRDIPEAITQGDDDAEAMAMAEDVLISSMDFYFEDRRIVPSPSAALPNELMVALPASVAVKVLLLNEMLAQKVGPSELARRLGTIPQVVNRLIDLHHTTKIDKVEQALGCLGKRLEFTAV